MRFCGGIMKKTKCILIVIISFLCVSMGIFAYFKFSTITIPDNPNLKISINNFTEPSYIETYYFYDDTVIDISCSSGVLPDGPKSSTTITKYYFNEKIDITELKSFIEKMPIDTSSMPSVQITEKNGETYYIDDSDDTTKLSIIHAKLIAEIRKITDQAVRTQER